MNVLWSQDVAETTNTDTLILVNLRFLRPQSTTLTSKCTCDDGCAGGFGGGGSTAKKTAGC